VAFREPPGNPRNRWTDAGIIDVDAEPVPLIEHQEPLPDRRGGVRHLGDMGHEGRGDAESVSAHKSSEEGLVLGEGGALLRIRTCPRAPQG